jgi:glycosyltransferase involved in cell wall biosynthesis
VILLSHPTGNANVRAVAQALERYGLLAEFHTTVADRVGLTGRVLSLLAAENSKRRNFSIGPEKIRLHPFRELVRQIAPKIGLSSLSRHESSWAGIDQVYRSLDRVVANRLPHTGCQACYLFEDGANESFQAATRCGMLRIYDLPIAYWRVGKKIQEEEASLNPEWAMTMEALRDSPQKLERKDQELEQADAVFCASTFTARSLDAFPNALNKPVYQIPYGAPSKVLGSSRQPTKKGQLLKLLFVGGLSQRKGLSYLFAAVQKLSTSVELTVVGRLPKETCPALERALSQHRHIESLPYEQILAEMEKADLFVFPSLFEGFGLVLLEAMSRGVPCITTPNTAGPDIITDGVDGCIVPIRDVDAIAGRIDRFRRCPDDLEAMSAAAIETARRMTWEHYGDETVRCIRELLAERDRD